MCLYISHIWGAIFFRGGQKLEDKRKLERRICYLDAYEQATDDLIGNASNIHPEGLMLISKAEIPLFKDLSISLVVPGYEESKIQLVINGVWNREYKYPELDFFNTGCRLIEPTPEVISALNNLYVALGKGAKSPYILNSFFPSEAKI
jgi:hypothetical protein